MTNWHDTDAKFCVVVLILVAILMIAEAVRA